MNTYPNQPPAFPESSDENLPETPGAPPQPGRWVKVELKGEKPIVVYVLIGLTVFIYLLQLASQFFFDLDIPAGLGLKVNQAILQGQFWRLLTPALLHGSILHIGFNMYALYAIGPGLERHYGHGRFLVLYTLSAFAGNVVSFIFSPHPSLGSSTAIFGLLGAEGVFLYQNKNLFGEMARRALSNVIIIAVVNLLIGLSPGIDNWGHLGGLLGGTAFAWFAGPILQVQGIYPSLSVEDTRGTSHTLRVGLAVGAFFIALTALAIALGYHA